MQASITTTPDTSSRSTRAAVVIFGTYSAQIAADHGLGPHTGAKAKITLRRDLRRSEALIWAFEAWGGWDSNPGPADYESAALTG